MAKRRKIEDDATILDYLNEDCWLHVLQFVPAREVVRTERASRRWQGVVLKHLQGVHINIIRQDNDEKTDFSTCGLKKSKYKSFVKWTSKLGSSVLSSYCCDWEDLATIGQNCPNLKTLKLDDMPDLGPENLHSLSKHFKCLENLLFQSCSVSDNCVSQFIRDKALKKLDIYHCNKVTGEFLNVINTSHLGRLSIECAEDGFEAQHLVSAVPRLGELTVLILCDVGYEVAEEMQSLLGKMPKLEQLEIYNDCNTYCQTTEPISRLTYLKELETDFAMHDEDLEIMMNGCRELRSLKLLDCKCLTSRGATDTLVRRGARLSAVLLDWFGGLRDAGVLALVRGCTQLTSLEISWTWSLTPVLPERAEVAWREARPRLRLRLDLSRSNLKRDKIPYGVEGEEREEMKREFVQMRRKYNNLCLVFEPVTS